MKARKIPPAGPSAVGLPEDRWDRYRTERDTARACSACGGTGYLDHGRSCGRCGSTGMLRSDTIGRENSKDKVRSRQSRHIGRDGIRKPTGGK